MLSKIIDGISIKLNQVFGDEIEIYSESIEQGLTEPCFFILLVASSSFPLLGTRSKKENLFDIHYFPCNKQKRNTELFKVTELLYEELEWITLQNGDVLHGIRKNAQIIDGVLHFFVTFHLITIREVKKERFEGLELNTTIRKDGAIWH